MYTGGVVDTGYYLDNAEAADVRAQIAVLLERGAVVVEPVDWAANATVSISVHSDAVTKSDLERVLGRSVLDEDDVVLSADYDFLMAHQPA